MSKRERALTIHLGSLSEQGQSLNLEVEPDKLGLPDEGRTVFKEPVKIDLFLALVKGQLLVQGRVIAFYEGVCDRCLEPFKNPLNVDGICYYFDELDNEEIDLTEPLREDILLNFPQRLLCSDDCAGLCPSCGKCLKDGVCDCAAGTSEENPWTALDGFQAE